MLDFKDKTPYEILNVSETAFTPVIERQLRHKLSLYCSLDRNATDAYGNDLKTIFEEAARTLMDPELRKKLDKRLQQEWKLIELLNSFAKQSKDKEESTGYIILKPNGTLYISNDRSIDETEISVPIHKTTLQSNKDLNTLIQQINLHIINNPDILNDIYPEKNKTLKKE